MPAPFPACVAILLSLLAFAPSCRNNAPKPAENHSAPPKAAPSESATGAANAPTANRGPRVYVSNEDSNNISVIDSATDEVTGTIFVGKRPRGIRLSPDGKTLFVALSGSAKDPPGARYGGRASAPDRAAQDLALAADGTPKRVPLIPR